MNLSEMLFIKSLPSVEDKSFYFPGLFLAEIANSGWILMHAEDELDREEISDYIDKLYIYAKEQGMDTQKLNGEVKELIRFYLEEARSAEEENLIINEDEFLKDFELDE